MLPLIGVITSLGTIASIAFLLFTRWTEWDDYDERYKGVICIVCLFIAGVILIVSIPGLVNSVIGVISGVLAAVIALLGFVGAEISKVYTARQTARWTLEVETQKLQVAGKIEDQKQSEAAFDKCLDEISGLLSNMHSGEIERVEHTVPMVRSKILATLPRIDGNAKGTILQCLSETNLINRAHGIDSHRTPHMKLVGADMSHAHLAHAHLAHADLHGCDLRSAEFDHADLSDADLENANLYDADLSYARGIIKGQLEKQTENLKGAIMPDGSKHP
jgi:hypothetical protein